MFPSDQPCQAENHSCNPVTPFASLLSSKWRATFFIPITRSALFRIWNMLCCLVGNWILSASFKVEKQILRNEVKKFSWLLHCSSPGLNSGGLHPGVKPEQLIWKQQLSCISHPGSKAGFGCWSLFSLAATSPFALFFPKYFPLSNSKYIESVCFDKKAIKLCWDMTQVSFPQSI